MDVGREGGRRGATIFELTRFEGRQATLLFPLASNGQQRKNFDNPPFVSSGVLYTPIDSTQSSSSILGNPRPLASPLSSLLVLLLPWPFPSLPLQLNTSFQVEHA